MARVGSLDIAYDTFGQGGRPLVLIQGIGAQMIHWEDDFCQGLADLGFFVVRFDNRDVGESTWLDDAGRPQFGPLVTRRTLGLTIEAPYTLYDMADDTAGLMAHLGLRQAHIVGLSMGGMIAQCFAIRYPERTLSLTSIMSSTGERRFIVPTPKALKALFQKPPRNKDDAFQNAIRFFEGVGGGGPIEAERIRVTAELAFERGVTPGGFMRQFAAVLATGGRSKALSAVTAPTLVMHGTKDPLVIPSGGVSTARAVPNARLELIEGLGHEIPSWIWPRFYAGIEWVTGRAEALLGPSGATFASL